MKTTNTFAMIRIYNRISTVFLLLSFLSFTAGHIYIYLNNFNGSLFTFFLGAIFLVPFVAYSNAAKEIKNKKLQK